jgi:hypothetical protein
VLPPKTNQMKNSKELTYRIAEKLDQTEKGYVVPKITYIDNKQTILLEYPKKKFIINVTEV